MAGLTPIPWQRFERFLLTQGCQFVRQKGSHRVYWKAGLPRPLIVPTRKDLPVFIIRNNVRLLGLSIEDYLQKLDDC